MVILGDCVSYYFYSGGLETETVTLNINKLDLAKTAFFSQQYFYLCVLMGFWNKTSWIIIAGLFIISNYVSLLQWAPPIVIAVIVIIRLMLSLLPSPGRFCQSSNEIFRIM